MASLKIGLKKQRLCVPSTILLLTIFLFSAISSHAKIVYQEHCSIIPTERVSSFSLETNSQFYISTGYVSGGNTIFGPNTFTSSSSYSNKNPLPKEFTFFASQVYRTQNPNVLELTGHLQIEGKSFWTVSLASTRGLSHWPSRYSKMHGSNGWTYYDMSGFWSKSEGKLCMVGHGSTYMGNGTSLQTSAVFNLNYPNELSILTSIVSGTVESLEPPSSSSHFDKLSVLGYTDNNYIYTLTPQFRSMCSGVKVPTAVLVFDAIAASNHSLRRLLSGRYQLEYGRDCSTALNCGPFSHKNNRGFLPTFMSLTLGTSPTKDEGKVHMLLGFTNSSSDASYFPSPESSLVGEGYWDPEKNVLCLLACQVQDILDISKDSTSVGECTIGVSFWFPAIYTIKDRSGVVGRIWSVRGTSDPGHFRPISFRSLEKQTEVHPGAKYKYTRVDTVQKTCENMKTKDSGTRGRYPDENSIEDLVFDITVTNNKERSTTGYATLVSFGDSFYGDSFSKSSKISFSVANKNASQALWYVSYEISYGFYNTSLNEEVITDIAAEGVYNKRTGKICLVGCRTLSSTETLKNGHATEPGSDCEIRISIQLSPINIGNGEYRNGSSLSSSTHLNGTIKSTREKLDPLYFGPLEISSHTIYATEALETIRRMDMEIVMVMFSLTLSCILIILQIFHVRKQPDVLPSISILMLVILVLGYMVPLLLNFEALIFKNRSQNFLRWTGGWLEANEVIMRVMTMLAFLLQYRFLQLAWTARSSKDDQRAIWNSERKALQLCLPWYITGALITWFIHKRYSIWEGLMHYVGLILDGYLLPQVILNVVCNSKDKALAPLFYTGTTALRSVPHLYDAYRARNYVPYSNSSYIYASPDGDYYSTAWDIIIPLVGILLALVIFLQQRFGGTCLLPRSSRKPGGYQTVPTISL